VLHPSRLLAKSPVCIRFGDVLVGLPIIKSTRLIGKRTGQIEFQFFDIDIVAIGLSWALDETLNHDG